MGSVTYDDKATGGPGNTGYFTPDDANEIKGAVNDNDSRLNAMEAVSGLLKISSGEPVAATAGEDYLSPAVNITDPGDQTWQGRTAPAVAGEAMTEADRWRPLCRKDVGSGTRYFFYDPDSTNSDNDEKLPVALLATNGTISPGDAITIAYGDGILANDDWTAAQANVGEDLFCVTGGVSFTKPPRRQPVTSISRADSP